MGSRRRVTGDEASGVTAPSSVPVSSIAHNPRNLRDESEYEDVDDYAASMAEAGVVTPIGVVRYEVYLTHYPEDEEKIGSADWVALNGNMRLAAARKAGLTEVPVHVLDRLGRDNQFDEVVLIENIHRRRLAPLREAQGLQQLVDRHGSQHKVAKRIGMTQPWVSQRLSLLKLPEVIQQALAKGKVTVEAAREIAALPADQREMIAAGGPPFAAPPKDATDNGVISPVKSNTGDNALIDDDEPPARPTRSKAGSYVTIKVPPHDLGRLVEAIRAQFTETEVGELISLLQE